jgi:putative transport protein
MTTSCSQLGDRVRVVGPSDLLGAVARLFGDSERRLAEVDALGFALGATAGLAVGPPNLPLPGGIDVELGAGGGPLLIGLVLGIVSRTGPITWQIPHGANLVLRQLGILMFLATAALGSGTPSPTHSEPGMAWSWWPQVSSPPRCSQGLCRSWLRLCCDAMSSRQRACSPASRPNPLATNRVSSAYALVFPAAMIAKIITVQFLV